MGFKGSCKCEYTCDFCNKKVDEERQVLFPEINPVPYIKPTAWFVFDHFYLCDTCGFYVMDKIKEMVKNGYHFNQIESNSSLQGNEPDQQPNGGLGSKEVSGG